MKLHRNQPGKENIIQSFDQNCVTINNREYHQSLIVYAENIISPWKPKSIQELSADDWQACYDLQLDLILLGTGDKLRFPDTERIFPLMERQIGLECMTTAAACRTYNIIVADGRRVAAAIMLG